MLLLSNNYILFTNDNFLGTAMSIYVVTTSYSYNGTCLNSYYISGSQCVKKLSYVPPVPLTPITITPTPTISNTNQTPPAEIQNLTT